MVLHSCKPQRVFAVCSGFCTGYVCDAYILSQSGNTVTLCVLHCYLVVPGDKDVLLLIESCRAHCLSWPVRYMCISVGEELKQGMLSLSELKSLLRKALIIFRF